MSFKAWDRYSLASLAQGESDPLDPRGRLFMSGLGQVNLSHVNLLREGVDTIRQLYSGCLRWGVFDLIRTVYNQGLAGRRRIINLLGRDWLLGSGGASGYRFRLQDNDLGLILLVGSRFLDECQSGSHLKIEVSPHYIDAYKAVDIQRDLDRYADQLLYDPKPSGVAVHLCVNVQGWEPARNLTDLLVTRSRRRIDHRGISNVEFDLSEIASIYGASQSFLFGSASGLQFSLYRKDLQAQAVDKTHFWEAAWSRRTDDDFKPLYDASKPVWRFECRYHHSVVDQFSEHLGESLTTFLSVVPHLTGLWRYGLSNFRLNAVSTACSRAASIYRGVYIDPLWQLLLQDVEFYAPDPGLYYKRARKKPGQGGLKNVHLAFGNLLSVYARKGFTPWQALKSLKQSGIWEEYVVYFRSKFDQILSDQVLDSKVTDVVAEGLQARILAGMAA